MKKLFYDVIKKLLSLSGIFIYILALTACPTDIEPTVTLTGSISINTSSDASSLLTDDSSPALQNSLSASRTAIVSPDASLLYWTVTAYMGNRQIEGTVNNTGSSFSIGLPAGYWILRVRAYNNGTTHDSSTLVLEGISDSYEINTDNNLNYSGISVTVKPVSSGNGSLNLKYYLAKSIIDSYSGFSLTGTLKEASDSYTVTCETSTSTVTIGENVYYQGTITKTGIPAGVYTLTFGIENSETDSSTTPPTTTTTTVIENLFPETVNIFMNLETSTWTNNCSTGSTIQGIKWLQSVTTGSTTETALVITQSLFDEIMNKCFYVNSSTNVETSTGSYKNPYKTLQEAADRVLEINDGTSEYTIYLANTYSVSTSTSQNQLPEYICSITTREGKPLKLKITTSGPSNQIKINANNRCKIFSFNSNVDNGQLYLTLENLILTNAKNSSNGWCGSAISMDNILSLTNRACEVTLRNCTISNCNGTYTDASAVHNSANCKLTCIDTEFLNNVNTNSASKGGAVSLWGPAVFKRCSFYGNKSDGATALSNAGGAVTASSDNNNVKQAYTVEFEGCRFENNSSTSAGGAYGCSINSDDQLVTTIIKDCTFTGNKSGYPDSKGGGAVYHNSSDPLKLSGKNIITGNYHTEGSGTTATLVEDNIFLPEGKTITLLDDLSGSRIGIYQAAELSSAPAALCSLTDDNNSINPDEVFTCDRPGYFIYKDGTSSIKIKKGSNAGSITTEMEKDFTLVPNPAPDSTTKVITISPKIIKNEDLEIFQTIDTTLSITPKVNDTAQNVNDYNWSYSLYSHGTRLPGTNTSSNDFFTVTKTEESTEEHDTSIDFSFTYKTIRALDNFTLTVTAEDKETANRYTASYLLRTAIKGGDLYVDSRYTDANGNIKINGTSYPRTSFVAAMDLEEPTVFIADKENPNSSETTIPYVNGLFSKEYKGKTVIINPFIVCQFETTQKLYQALNNNNDGTSDLLPAGNLNWFQAVVFCNLLSMEFGLEPVFSYQFDNGPVMTNPADWFNDTEHLSATLPENKNSTNYNNWFDEIKIDLSKDGFRLPTKTEWEFVHRGGDRNLPDWDYSYSGTNSTDDLINYSWNSKNSGNTCHDVGTKKPNRLNTYDISGNMQEWFLDTHYGNDMSFDDNTDVNGTIIDPFNKLKGVNVVLCVSNYTNYPDGTGIYSIRGTHVRNDGGNDPTESKPTEGFRMARTITERDLQAD